MDTNNHNQAIKSSQIRYCLYARKSSESDERQAMSIDSQIREMNELANRDGLFIKDIRQESHSAKQSGSRPVFIQLLKNIKDSQFNGILTWAPDRLSRNAGDLGTIVDLMDQGKLEEICTPSQVFRNTPNEKFLLMILCSQAKLENDNKGLLKYNGLLHEGKHDRFISNALFERVQKVMKRKTTGRHNFPFGEEFRASQNTFCLPRLRLRAKS